MPQTQPKQIRYVGLGTTAANADPRLLVQVKRFVSRSLKGAKQETAPETRISEAQEEVTNQAAYRLWVLETPKDVSVFTARSIGMGVGYVTAGTRLAGMEWEGQDKSSSGFRTPFAVPVRVLALVHAVRNYSINH